MDKRVEFRFTLPQRAATLNTGTEVVKIKDNCAWLLQSDAQTFLDNKLGKIEEGEMDVDVDATTGDPQGDEGTADNKEMLKALLKKSVDELQTLAIESDLPEEEWKGLTKPNLVNYLIEKAFNKPE